MRSQVDRWGYEYMMLFNLAQRFLQNAFLLLCVFLSRLSVLVVRSPLVFTLEVSQGEEDLLNGTTL